MDWDDSRLLDMLCFSTRLADYPRALNRVRVAECANGYPPYSEQEVEDNKIVVNASDLAMARILHDARIQFNNMILKTGNFFTCRTDAGPKHKRAEWGAIRTQEINRVMKRSIRYFEAKRAKFASLVLHGIGPHVWENQDCWCIKPMGLEDVMLPDGVLIGFDNLPWFIIYRSFTAYELQRLAKGPHADKHWNSKLVDKCLAWADQQATQLMRQNWPEVWAPEKQSERVKEMTGAYASSQVPTINCFDIYAYDDRDNGTGWIRRLILDAWATPSKEGNTYNMVRAPELESAGMAPKAKDDFLYSSQREKIADSWQNIVGFTFADLSAVAPFRYHSVRGLGWLLYEACEIQNRMKCRFYEAVFEGLQQYFRVKSADDAQQVLEVMLANRKFIDPRVEFVKKDERWQVDSTLVELGMKLNAQDIERHAASYTPNTNYSADRTEKTKFQVMAEVNAINSMVSAALSQAYRYDNAEYQEISRRFCKANSDDPDVRRVRQRCLDKGISAKVLNDPEVWQVEAERIMGGGNKTMEMAIAQQLMEWRMAFDPEPQRDILRDAVLAITDDPDRANSLVPRAPVQVTDSVHDAQLAAGVLAQGLPVAVKTGINHVEYIETLLKTLALMVQQAQQNGGMPDPRALGGMQNIAQHIDGHIQILAQDPAEKERVKQYGDALNQLVNFIKAFGQRLQEAMQKQAQAQAQGNGQMDPKDQAKIQAMMMETKVKTELQRERSAQRQAQDQLRFEEQMRQEQIRHGQQLQQQSAQHRQSMAAQDLEAAAQINRDRLDALSEARADIQAEQEEGSEAETSSPETEAPG